MEFDTLSIAPPYYSRKWEQAIKDAVEGGYDVLVLDSISHQWSGEGGILSRKEALDKQGGNSFTNWAKFTPEQEQFKSAINNAGIHIIATLRAKQEYVLTENQRGKQEPKKIGMAPVQREGMEYEFSVVFELQMSHRAIVSKDRTGLFPSDEAGTLYDLTDPAHGKTIREWLKTAKPLPTAEERAMEAERILRDTARLPGTKDHFEGYGGSLVSEVPTDLLDRALTQLRAIDAKKVEEGGEAKYAEVCEAIGLVMAKRLDEEMDQAALTAAAADGE